MVAVPSTFNFPQPPVPLGHDANGNPLPLPPEAAGWRVRRHAGGRGRPGIVYDPSGGPLVVRLRATLDALRAAGCTPGPCRLDACDATGNPLSVTAYTEVPAEEEGEGDAAADTRTATSDSALARTAI